MSLYPLTTNPDAVKRRLADIDVTSSYDYEDLIVDPNVEGFDPERIAEVTYLLFAGHSVTYSWVAEHDQPYNEDLKNHDRLLVQTAPCEPNEQGQLRLSEEGKALMEHHRQGVLDAIGASAAKKGKTERYGIFGTLRREYAGDDVYTHTAVAHHGSPVADYLSKYRPFSYWQSNTNQETSNQPLWKILGLNKEDWELVLSLSPAPNAKGLQSLLDEEDDEDRPLAPTSKAKAPKAKAERGVLPDDEEIVRVARRKPTTTVALPDDLDDEEITVGPRRKAGG